MLYVWSVYDFPTRWLYKTAVQTYRPHTLYLYIILFWHVIHFCTPVDLWNENKFCSLPFFSVHKLTRKLWVNTVNSLVTFLLLNCYYILWDVRFSWWLQRSLPSGTWHYVGHQILNSFWEESAASIIRVPQLVTFSIFSPRSYCERI